MKAKLYFALFATVISYSGIASASPANFTNNGNYTSDSVSNLDWLDVSATAGKSYNDVTTLLGSPGDLVIGSDNYGSGWHYATDQQFADMVFHYTNVDITDPPKFGFHPVLPPTEARDLISLLGPSGNRRGVNYTAGLMLDTDPSTPATVWYGGLAYQPPALTTTSLGAVFAHYRDYSSDLAAIPDYNAGSFLVRDSVSAVPLPATALLLAPALFGLIGFRRKLKA